MQSQIEYELDVLKSGNYDQALQFIEHLVNILVRMKNALTNNDYVSNRVPQQEDDNFWGYTFNFIAKVVDFELDAMYAVTYRNNQLTLLFNPKEIEDDYTVETMLEGLRHEGYHLLFNHLNVHKNYSNYCRNYYCKCYPLDTIHCNHSHCYNSTYKRTRNLTNRHPCRIINRRNVYHPRPKYHKRKIKKLCYKTY